MRGTEFLDKMELIDPAYIEAADVKPKKKKSVWVKWGAMAACLCLVIGGIAAYQTGVFDDPTGSIGTGEDDSIAAACGFYLGDNKAAVYYPISFDEAKDYGLVPEGASGVKDIFSITEDDIGELMGIVMGCGDEALNGCNVYHFSKYPEKDSICIVDTPNGYKFFVCSWLNIESEIGTNSDVFLSAYDLPESLETMELLASDWQHIANVTDPATVMAVLEILAGKTNIGLEASERRFAQAWYDAYGNDDVHYSEEVGHCVYRGMDLSDKAHALWSNGERIIRITTENGYRLDIDYFPSVRMFQCTDGYYELSPNEAEALNSLLQLTE